MRLKENETGKKVCSKFEGLSRLLKGYLVSNIFKSRVRKSKGMKEKKSRNRDNEGLECNNQDILHLKLLFWAEGPL